MVVPEKRISKYIVSFCYKPSKQPTRTLPINIEIDTPRGQSVCTSSNSSREALAHSDALSMAYVN